MKFKSILSTEITVNMETTILLFTEHTVLLRSASMSRCVGRYVWFCRAWNGHGLSCWTGYFCKHTHNIHTQLVQTVLNIQSCIHIQSFLKRSRRFIVCWSIKAILWEFYDYRQLRYRQNAWNDIRCPDKCEITCYVKYVKPKSH